MARFEYDEGKVSSALLELEEAKKSLDNVNTEINEGISIIEGARGSNFISVDFSSILGLKDTSIEYIDTVISDINKNVAAIEEYNSAPWYKKVLATVGMASTKIVEGLGTGCEQIVDGFASGLGMVAGVFSSDAKEAIGEFVKKDYVGDAFAASYENGMLSGIEKYSAFSSTSTAANVFKGVGVATTYIAIAAATGGIGAAAGGGAFAAGAAQGVASIGLNAAIAGVGGLGAGTQSGLQEGKSYNSAFLGGVKDGAISAGTVYVAGKIGQKLTKTTASSPALTEGTPAALPAGTETASLTSANLADDASRLIGEATNSAKSGVQYTARTVDDLARLSNSSKLQNIVDSAKSMGAKGYSVSSDGVMTLYDSAGKVLKVEKIFNSTVNAAASTADDVASTVSKVTSVTDNGVDAVINSGKVLNADGSTAAYFATKDATLAEKASATIKNVGLNFSDKASNVGSKISTAASAVGEKVSPIAASSKEVFRSVGTEIATNPVAEGTVIAQGINGIRTSSSNSVATEKANYVFNSNGTVSEKTGETVSPSEEKTIDNNDDNSSNKTNSQNIYNNNKSSNNTTSSNNNVSSSTNTNIESTTTVDNVETLTAETTTTVDNVDTLTTETTTENIDNNINNNSSTENSNTYNEYTTNNYNSTTNNSYTTNDYNTTNNYNTSNTATSTQKGTIALENSSSGETTTTVIQESVKYASSNNTIETPTSNTQTIVENVKPTINNNPTTPTSSINANTSTITNKNNYKNVETITQTPTENTSSASTIKKVLGTVAGVGAVGSAAGLGYKAYKKYENGDFPIKHTKKENDTEDEYNFVDGKWHDEDDTTNDYYMDDKNSNDNQDEYE